MPQTIDLTKPAKTAFAPAPPAQAIPGLTGGLPLPLGKPVRLKSPSPGERAVLEQGGWQDGDPVPENLAEIIEQAQREATDIGNLPPPGDLSTPVLKVPLEKDISDLPLDQQDEYRKLLAGALATTKQAVKAEQELDQDLVPAAGKGINEAIRAATSPPIIDDRAAATALPGAAATDKPAPVHCQHCGWFLERQDDIEVTEQDKLNYLQALMGLIPFQKQFSLLGGRLHIAVRSLTVEEHDMCYRQFYVDSQKQRFTVREEGADWLSRYRAALQLVSIKGLVELRLPKTHTEWSIPEDIKSQLDEDDTPVRGVWFQLCRQALNNADMYRYAVGTVGKFNNLHTKLEANQDNPDFWQATDSPG